MSINEKQRQGQFIGRWIHAIRGVLGTLQLRWWIVRRQSTSTLPSRDLIPSDAVVKEAVDEAMQSSSDDWFHCKLREECFLDELSQDELCDELLRCLNADEVDTPYGKVHVLNAYHRILDLGCKGELLNRMESDQKHQLASVISQVLSYLSLAVAA